MGAPGTAAAPRNIRKVQPTRIIFGQPAHFDGPEVAWDSRTAINGHMLLAGGSGSGKTHTLRRITRELVGCGARRVLILDVHGDIIPDVPHQTVKFSEQTEFGLNPLAISADRDFGGVRKRINAFVSMLNRTGQKLGPKQEATIRALLNDLYEANGFKPEDPETWNVDIDPRRNPRYPKKMPAVPDLQRFIANKYRSMRFGGSSRSVSALERLTKAYQRLQSKNTQVHKGTASPEDLLKLKEECITLYVDAINNIDTGREIEDMLRYDSPDTVKSLLDRIESLVGAGIFRGKAPPFDPKVPVWRYDIKALSRSEQAMFVDCLLEDLFFQAKQDGETDGPETFVIVDETASFITDEPDHIPNVISREGRKFGLALILASQSLIHYSDDMLMSAGVKLILGVDEMYHEPMRRKLGLEMADWRGKKVNPFTFIRPKATAMVQVKNTGTEASSRLMMVKIAS